MKRYLLIIIYIFFQLRPDISAQPVQFKFDQLTVEDGLSSNRIRCIYRDSKDLLWLGTEVGLDRFDSQNFIKFRYTENKKGSISSDHITCIYEDRNNNLWFGSDDGLNLYDSKTESFKVYRHEPDNDKSLDSDRVDSMIEDENGNLWVVTGSNCLNKWLPEKEEFLRFRFLKERNLLNAPPVDMIDIDSNGDLWLTSFKTGIFKFDTELEKFEKFDDPIFDFGNDCYKSLYIDNDDKIWIITDGSGFLSYDPLDNSFYKYPTNVNGSGVNQSTILDIIPEGDRYLLLAVDQGGINIFDKKNQSFQYIVFDDLKNNSGLNNNGIWCFHRDREGILWVGTSGGGVNYHNPKKKRFELYRNNPIYTNSLAYNFTGCFYEDTSGEIWIGTDGGGISVYNPKTGNFKTYRHDPMDPFSLSGNTIRSIDGDSDQNIWIGTWDAGLNRFDKRTGKFHRYMPDSNDSSSISGRTVWSLKVGQDDLIWLGIHNVGVELFDKDKGVVKRISTGSNSPIAGLGSVDIYFYEDEIHNMWISSSQGLAYYNTSTNSINYYHQFPDNRINAFCKDSKGNYWAGSSRKGIFMLDDQGTVIRHYTEEDGLSDNNIKGILEDNQGMLWISTNNGLNVFNPLTEHFRTYSSEDGLQGNQFFIHSFYKSKNGQLFFGGFNGFNSFQPAQLVNNDFKPQVYFTDFQLYNESVKIGDENSPLLANINEMDQIKIPWGHTVFSLGFVGINYTNPDKSQYKYWLEGFDQDWILTNSDRNYATYTNLDPGEYTFHVKASNNDGLWNEIGNSIDIIIIPPFWQTLWFKGLLTVLIAGLIYLAYFLRVHQLKKYSINLEKKVQERTLQLKDMVNELKAKQDEIEATNEELTSTLEDLFHQKTHTEKINDELKDAHEELQQINEQLDSRAQERTQKLVKANKELDRFVYSASHDLGAPLKSIHGIINITRIENRNKKLNEHIDHMEKSVLKLDNVIKSLTQFSRNTGKKIEKDIICFDHLVEEVLDELKFSYEKSNIKFEKKYTGKEKINTDLLRLKIVLHNLFSNAIKYRKMDSDDSKVSIEFYEDNNKYRIIISDNGIGINKDIIDKIFIMFYRGSEQSDGSGLGLYIVQEILQKLKGSIKLASEQGKFTLADITIPK